MPGKSTRRTQPTAPRHLSAVRRLARMAGSGGRPPLRYYCLPCDTPPRSCAVRVADASKPRSDKFSRSRPCIGVDHAGCLARPNLRPSRSPEGRGTAIRDDHPGPAQRNRGLRLHGSRRLFFSLLRSRRAVRSLRQADNDSILLDSPRHESVKPKSSLRGSQGLCTASLVGSFISFCVLYPETISVAVSAASVKRATLFIFDELRFYVRSLFGRSRTEPRNRARSRRSPQDISQAGKRAYFASASTRDPKARTVVRAACLRRLHPLH